MILSCNIDFYKQVMADPEYCVVWYLLVMQVLREEAPDFIFVSAGDHTNPLMCMCS